MRSKYAENDRHERVRTSCISIKPTQIGGIAQLALCDSITASDFLKRVKVTKRN